MSHNNSATTTRLLLVDNEPDNTSVLSMGLEDEGYIVDAFTDPILALSNFKPNYYSLVILDINMPKMNGYDLYKEIRKLDNKVKICFLTASELYNENLRRQTKEILNEVKRFISKPLTLEDLVIKVTKIHNKSVSVFTMLEKWELGTDGQLAKIQHYMAINHLLSFLYPINK